MNFIITFTDSNRERYKDVEHHDQEETLQQQNETVISLFNAEPTGTENINLPWMTKKQQNKFMLALQVYTVCLT